MNDLKQAIAREYGTPVVVVDLDIVSRNIDRLQAKCDANGILNRPHIKTHKSPAIAQLQQAAGADGFTCQKLGEAEVMVEAGFRDILISYNLIGSNQMQRLAHLMNSGRIIVAADSLQAIQGYAQAARWAGRPLEVVVECDTGRKRTGVETPAEAIALARAVGADRDLTLAGFMFYSLEDTVRTTQRFIDDALTGARAYDLSVSIVSTGGTPNAVELGKLKSVTEHRAGTYVFNDRKLLRHGVAALTDCALHVYSTVVSRAADGRCVLDAGSKALTYDTGGLDGFGLIREYPNMRIPQLSEEHGFVDFSGSSSAPDIGEVVRVLPNHACVVVNMVDRLVAVRGETLIGEIPVAARGKSS